MPGDSIYSKSWLSRSKKGANEMALTKREEIYDDQISPLMTKIIELCKEHDIPLIVSAQLNDDREGDTDLNEDGDPLGQFYCTTFLLPENSGQKLKAAYQHLKPEPKPYWGAFVGFPDGTRQQVAGSDMEDGES